MNEQQMIEMVGKRAAEIAKTESFRQAVIKAGCKTEEEIKQLGYMMAIATLCGVPQIA